MGAASGLHADDALDGKDTVLCQEFGVFFGIDIVGDDTDAVVLCHTAGQGFDEGSFSGTYRTGDSYFHK